MTGPGNNRCRGPVAATCFFVFCWLASPTQGFTVLIPSPTRLTPRRWDAKQRRTNNIEIATANAARCWGSVKNQQQNEEQHDASTVENDEFVVSKTPGDDGAYNHYSRDDKSHSSSSSSSGGAARHQLEHRATEKGALGMAHRLLDQLEKVMEHASKRTTERFGEKLSQRASESAAERVGEKLVERAGERALERASESTAERVGEKLVERAGERALERVSESTAERAGEKLLERAGERGLERVSESAAERVGEKVAERASETVGKRTIERAGDGIVARSNGTRKGVKHLFRSLVPIGQTSERAVAQHGTERLVEHVAERAGEESLARSGERALENIVATEIRSLEQVGSRSTEHALGRIERIMGVSTERLARRIGRGLMIALPVLGGVFALYLFRSDYKRWKLELHSTAAASCHGEGAATGKGRPSLALVLLGGAGVADLTDAILHFVIAYGLFIAHKHRLFMLAEELSMGCAVLSTGFAVLGEIASARRRKRLQVASP